jgi:hypothetical protein
MTAAAMTTFVRDLPSVLAIPSRKPNKDKKRPPPSPRSLIPNTSAVYFILDRNGAVQYVGAARNIRFRWFQHHQRSQVRRLPKARLAWLGLHPNYLATVEAQFIRKLDPPLNRNNQRYQGSTGTVLKYKREKQKKQSNDTNSPSS